MPIVILPTAILIEHKVVLANSTNFVLLEDLFLEISKRFGTLFQKVPYNGRAEANAYWTARKGTATRKVLQLHD